ncbi:MAG: hypothetical protein IJI71_01465 [Clostridia bacterium]|nr:hypothetical protein [Clostridia bacterium]
MLEVNGRIRRGWLVLVPVLAIFAAAFVFALVKRNHALALAALPLLIVAFIYGFVAHLWPNLRYRRFLQDMANGLSRDVRGVIVNVADAAELQDGAMVLPVRVQLTGADSGAQNAASALSERIQQLEAGEDTREERILYLNASKRDRLPPVGAAVTLHCFGRHIRSAEVA